MVRRVIEQDTLIDCEYNLKLLRITTSFPLLDFVDEIYDCRLSNVGVDHQKRWCHTVRMISLMLRIVILKNSHKE